MTNWKCHQGKKNLCLPCIITGPHSLEQWDSSYVWPFKTDVPRCAQWSFLNQLYQGIIYHTYICIYTHIPYIYIYILYTHTVECIHLGVWVYEFWCMYAYICITTKIQNVFITPDSYLISFAVNPHTPTSPRKPPLCFRHYRLVLLSLGVHRVESIELYHRCCSVSAFFRSA